MPIKIDGRTYDLAELSREELLDLKLGLDTTVDDIRTQLDQARSRARASGQYADPRWYHSARRARQRVARKSQTIQHQLSRRKQARRSQGDPFPRRFMKATKLLPELRDAGYRVEMRVLCWPWGNRCDRRCRRPRPTLRWTPTSVLAGAQTRNTM